MLSHRNILFNAHAASHCGPLNADDVFLSFLPLSHTLERTAGYYLPMLIGAEVAFARSIAQLGEDLKSIQPTVLISVPRIYESVYAKIQAGLKQRSAFARTLFQSDRRHRLEPASSVLRDRANWSPRFLLWPLLERMVARKVLDPPGWAHAVCGLRRRTPSTADRPLLHRTRPARLSRLRPDRSQPGGDSEPARRQPARVDRGSTTRSGNQYRQQRRIADPQPVGDVRVLAERRGNAGRDRRNKAGCTPATRPASTKQGHVFITGRIKDIIVLGNGEKLPPADMEMAIQLDSLFDQVLIVGEGRPFLSALLVLNPETWRDSGSRSGRRSRKRRGPAKPLRRTQPAGAREPTS
jgi:long-chain acyl-CoA synthetase